MQVAYHLVVAITLRHLSDATIERVEESKVKAAIEAGRTKRNGGHLGRWIYGFVYLDAAVERGHSHETLLESARLGRLFTACGSWFVSELPPVGEHAVCIVISQGEAHWCHRGKVY